jgi:uncharacterized sulfatase
MLTAMSAHTTGDYENSGLIAPDLYSLVGHLAGHGYETVAMGKTHFAPQWPGHGYRTVRKGDFCECERSFEENEYYQFLKSAGQAEYMDLVPDSLGWGEFGALPSRLPAELSQEFWLARVACDWLAGRDASRPFFCHVSFSRPHQPWMPSAPFHRQYDPAALTLPPTHSDDWKGKPFAGRDRWKEPSRVFHYPRMKGAALRRALALYYGLISQVDAAVGRMLDALDRLGLAGNTIVAFCSDHGDFAGEHGILEKGIPTLDGIWRTPMIVSDPRPGFPRNEARGQLVNLIDLMPTLLDRAGVAAPAHVEGRSLAREIADPAWPGRDAVFFEYRHVKTVRTRDYALSYYSPGEEGFRDYEHASTWARGGELYDMAKDPGQFRNVYDDPAYAGVRLALTERLLEWFCNTERVHRLRIRPARPDPRREFDRCGMTKDEYRRHYMDGHPLL